MRKLQVPAKAKYSGHITQNQGKSQQKLKVPKKEEDPDTRRKKTERKSDKIEGRKLTTKEHKN